MSVESTIRELLTGKLNEAAFPGSGKNMETSAPMQGSSQKPNVELMHKGMGGQTAPSTASATMKARGGAAEMAPMKQGSSQDAQIATRDDQATQGMAHGKRAKKMPVPGQRGAGQAPNFSTAADPRSVINQPSSKGNVAQEEMDMEEGEFITEEEFESLSPEEQALYEPLEMDDIDLGDEGDYITEEEFEALSPEEQEMYEPFDGAEDVEEMSDEEIEELLSELSDDELDALLADEELEEQFDEDYADEELEEQFDEDYDADEDLTEEDLEDILEQLSDEELAELLEEALDATDLNEEDVDDFFLEAAEQDLTDTEAVAALQHQILQNYVANVLLTEGPVKRANKAKKNAYHEKLGKSRTLQLITRHIPHTFDGKRGEYPDSEGRVGDYLKKFFARSIDKVKNDHPSTFRKIGRRVALRDTQY